MIEVLQGLPDDVAAYRIGGVMSKEDYDVVLDDVRDRYSRHKKLSCYTEVDADFHGLEPGAVWEDVKLGVAHFFDWKRLALVTEVEWLHRGMKLWSLLAPLDARVFSVVEADAAKEWVAGA